MENTDMITGNAEIMQQQTEPAFKPKIGPEQIAKFNTALAEYKTGKLNLENKIVENEQFWKLRQYGYAPGKDKAKPASAWLWNCIVSKHADAHDAFPEPNILPREPTDKDEAKVLTSIVPVILDQNDFEDTYDDVMWYKLKQGTGVYGVFWDAQKHNGIGDIDIHKVDLLNLFWQPGITDIQDSRYLFNIDIVDREILEQRYPQLKGKTEPYNTTVKSYIYDDAVNTTDKAMVVDVYYHTEYGGKKVLHYCKYCGDTVIFATENDPNLAESGWYAHNLYPFVFDTLFDIEGSPAGYGYTDIGKSTQEQIDDMNAAMLRCTKMSATPRYFARMEGSINEDEFLDWTKPIVHVDGQLTDENIRELRSSPVDGNSISLYLNKIEELKETTGNRDVANGGTTSGVTAASAIAAMQEQSGKMMRDANKTSYAAYKNVVKMVIELIRQFYDYARQFRIVGESGVEEFISYSNKRIKGEQTEGMFGTLPNIHIPEFDIEVSAQTATMYTKISQNELALQMYNAGFFNPQLADQALACLEQMDFARKDAVMQRVQQNGTLAQMLQMWQQMAIGLAAKYEPAMAQGLAANAGVNLPGMGAVPHAETDSVRTDSLGNLQSDEHPFVSKSRAAAQGIAQPK